MNVFEFPFALLAFLGLVAVTPLWMHFISTSTYTAGLPTETTFLLQFTLPAFGLLFIAGWVGTDGGG